jgi:hypothetical protein
MSENYVNKRVRDFAYSNTATHIAIGLSFLFTLIAMVVK